MDQAHFLKYWCLNSCSLSVAHRFTCWSLHVISCSCHLGTELKQATTIFIVSNKNYSSAVTVVISTQWYTATTVLDILTIYMGLSFFSFLRCPVLLWWNTVILKGNKRLIRQTNYLPDNGSLFSTGCPTCFLQIAKTNMSISNGILH